MMRVLIILSFLFCSFPHSLLAEDDFVKADGSFFAVEDDSISFIKKQLNHSAFEKAISLKLDSLGLPSRLFWEKYNEKFKVSMDEVKESLLKKYSPNGEVLEGNSLKNFNKELRLKTSNARLKFGKLENLISSYSIKKSSRSTQNPYAHFISLEAKINTTLLQKIYYSFVAPNKTSQFKILYIQPEFQLLNSSYIDIGVDNERDFKEIVGAYWLKWFEENKPSNISAVKIVDDEMEKDLKNYTSTKDSELSSRESSELQNSLLLKISIKMQKEGESEEFNEYEFSFKGGLYVVDLNSNSTIYANTFNQESKVYRDLDYKNLSSKVANFVYRMPFSSFVKINSALKNATSASEIKIVRFESFPTLAEAMKLSKIIENKGLKNSVNIDVKAISDKGIDFLVRYVGPLSDLKGILQSSLEGVDSKFLTLVDSDNDLSIKYQKGE